MAKRKHRKRRSGLGEIKRSRKKVSKAIHRENGKERTYYSAMYANTHRAPGGVYKSQVCIGKAITSNRCGHGRGTTPTRSMKAALRQLAKRLK